MEKMTNYVLGFMFDSAKKNVVLIIKNRPNWQKGFLNGIGGHIEVGEDSFTAIAREFYEETDVQDNSWQPFVKMVGIDWTVYVFKAFSEKVYSCITKTDEEVAIRPVDQLKDLKVVPNLQWLIPMALDSINYNVEGRGI
jgi:8-oxo-dGTP diphosphatase